MKKATALFLALLLCLTLFSACGDGGAASTGTPAAGTPTAGAPASAPPATEPSEPEPEEGGLAVCIVPTMMSEGLVIIVESWQKVMEDAGYTAVIADAELDNANYVRHIEDYMTQGADFMLVCAMDAEAIGDSCKAAMEAGIFITMLGIEPESYEIDGGLITDFRATGEYCAMMALAWIEEFMDTPAGKVPVCINTYKENTNGVNRSEGFQDIIAASDIAYEAYTQDIYSSAEEGFNMAENALQQNPDIRVFITYEPDTAVGVNNYIMDNYAPEQVAEFAVFCCYQYDYIKEMIQLAKEDPTSGAIRGCISYGGTNEETGILLAEQALALLTGAEASPYWVYDPIGVSNSFDWELPA